MNNKLLFELAKKLGGDVIKPEDDQYEDFALGSAMDAVKTGENSGPRVDYLKTKNQLE
jgi:hypothetical protein